MRFRVSLAAELFANLRGPLLAQLVLREFFKVLLDALKLTFQSLV
jgi:hypothetical protein